MSVDEGNHWGFRELEVDPDLLEVGQFGLRRARGVFQDGTIFAMPDADPPPAPLKIDREVRGQVISLALPVRESGGAGGNDRTNDLRSQLLGRKPVYLLAPAEEFEASSRRPARRPGIEPEPAEAFTRIPVAHIIESRSDGQLVLDDRFIPTVSRCRGAPNLHRFLGELEGLIHQRAEALASKFVRGSRGTASELFDVLMLQSLNRHEPIVIQLAATAECHPEDLHRLAIGIAGELATFTSASRRVARFPIYRHDALRATFEPVIQALRACLSVVLSQSAIPIPLEQKRFGISVAQLSDRTLFDSSVFVLAARSDVPGADFRDRFPEQLKIGPVERIRDFVMMQLPGVRIDELPVPPRQMPHRAGFRYFQLERDNELWRALKSSAGIAIHVAGEFPGLCLELWAVRSGDPVNSLPTVRDPPEPLRALAAPGPSAAARPVSRAPIDNAMIPGDWSDTSFGRTKLVARPAAASARVDANLQFTVYRPKQVVAQVWLPLLAFAHLSDRPDDADPTEPHPLEEVAQQAEGLLSQRIQDYRSVVQPAAQAVTRESGLTFLPWVDGLEFDPPQQSFVWKGSVHRAVFLVRADAKLVGRTVCGKLSVFLGSLVIAEVPLGIPIVAETHAGAIGPPVFTESARRYRKIFASYSRKDESIVEECERYARVLGDEYMRDVVTLRAGEVWDKRLQSLIADADVFQLFWSWNSMDSPFVRAEWEHALQLGRREFVRPVYWEDPLPCRPEADLPPPELQRVHFQKLPPLKASSATALAVPAPSPDPMRIGGDEKSIRFRIRRLCATLLGARQPSETSKRVDAPPGSAVQHERNSPTSELGVLEPPFAMLDTIEIQAHDGSGQIQLIRGDITAVPPEHAVDVLVLSAFPGSYDPIEATVIGALQRKGISVRDLARRKQVDLRDAFSCWLSAEVPQGISGVQFKRILCFEPPYGDASVSVGGIFRALAPFVAGAPHIASVAMIIPATGLQGYDDFEILPPLLKSAIEWLRIGLPLRTIKIYVRGGAHAANARQIFAQSKRELDRQEPSNRIRHEYDAFISYARPDDDAATATAADLKEKGFRVFLDRLDLQHGVAWQQKIFEVLDVSRLVIALYSPDYVTSKVCQEEFNIAWARGRKNKVDVICPIYWRNAKLPTYMELLHFIDCRERRHNHLAEACRIISGKLGS